MSHLDHHCHHGDYPPAHRSHDGLSDLLDLDAETLAGPLIARRPASG